MSSRNRGPKPETERKDILLILNYKKLCYDQTAFLATLLTNVMPIIQGSSSSQYPLMSHSTQIRKICIDIFVFEYLKRIHGVEIKLNGKSKHPHLTLTYFFS